MDQDEFPSNAHAAKKGADKDEKRVVEQVTTGKVIYRKKPLGKRVVDMMVADDARGVGGYILFDVLVPAAKDVIADVVSQFVERVLFGSGRSTARRTGRRYGDSSNTGHVSYNRYSSPAPWNKERREERPQVRRSRGFHDFDEIILATRAEANEVIDRLYDLIGQYDQVTVGDLYDLVGKSGNFTDEKWGWTSIRGAGVTRVASGGYLLDLPKPEPLD